MPDLRDARESKRLTQSELGTMLGGVPKANICAWEKGIRSIPKKYRAQLKDILGFSNSDSATSRLEQKYISLLEEHNALLLKYIALLETTKKGEADHGN